MKRFLFLLVNGAWSVHISLLIQTRRYFTGRSIIMDSCFSWKQLCEVKMSLWWICFLQTHSFLLNKTLTDGLEWCGLLVDYCDVFISCLDSRSDGTHSLQRIYWWESDWMLHFSKSDEETDSSTSWMAWGGLYISVNFHFWVIYSFKYVKYAQLSSVKHYNLCLYAVLSLLYCPC